MRSRSTALSKRLGLWFAFSSVTLLVGVGTLLQQAVTATFEHAAEEIAIDEVDELREVLAKDDDALLSALRAEGEDERNEGVYFRVLTQEGRILSETPEMASEMPASSDFPPATNVQDARGTGVPFRSSAGNTFRIFSFVVSPTDHSVYTMQIAVDRTPEDRLQSDYRRLLWATVVAAAFLAMFIGNAIAIRGLKPIREMTEQVRRVGASRLNERVDPSTFPADLQPLAISFNAMLERLDEAFRRLVRFSGDIAHELRTPLANLSAELEVTLGRSRREEEYREVVGSSLEECGRLSRLVDNLLFLARAETPDVAVRRQLVDLTAEIENVKEFYQPVAAERGINLEVRAEDGATARVDRGLFQRAVSNLVDNSLRHTDSGGAIMIKCRRRDEMVELEVEDTGCGIPPEHVPHVFDRLYRVDSARSHSTGGAGLGLAIVKSVVDVHDGSIEIVSELGRGTRIRFTLPA